MTEVAAAALVVAALLAATDWWAVATGSLAVERLAKPAAIVALALVALTLEPRAPDPARGLVVLALAASFVGDVLLLSGARSGERRRFVGGMIAFGLAHLAYAASFALRPLDPLGLLAGVAVGLTGILAIGGPVLRGAGPGLRVPLVAYIAILVSMAVAAAGTRIPSAVVGAWSFVVSDAILAWTRFVDPDDGDGERRHRRVATHVTYHAAQVLLVCSLLA